MRKTLALIAIVAWLLAGCAVAATASPGGSATGGPPSSSAGASVSPPSSPTSSPTSSAGTYLVEGQALAGPTCPVEPASPKPGQCAPRPVAGATLLVKASNGSELARVVTAADGRFAVALPAGSYTLVPQRVQGILTVAPPVAFSVAAGHVPTDLRVEYDTGIR